ncbi:MAG: PAS domain S-box protein [Kiritimatiellae bacterium]|jgi:two-component system cell cycle sensor histidine kinase/response regulator CckA|nr:PAS domain S-box protein [Kiritimatiellia bacterium]
MTNKKQQNIDSQFQRIFDLAAVGIVHVSSTGEYLKVNQYTCNLTGYTKKELIGKSVAEITHPEDIAFDKNLLTKLVDKECEAEQMKKRYIRKDGSIVWVEISISVALDNHGTLEYIIGIVQDISKQKATEEALIQSEEHYKLLATNTLATIWTTDLEMNITYVNDAVFRLLGYTPEEFFGLHPVAFTPKKDFDKLTLAAKKLIDKYQKGELVQGVIETQQIRKDGTIIDVEIICNPLINHSGEVTGFQGRSIDITERKKNENKLVETNMRLKLATDAGEFGVWDFDIVNNKLVWNDWVYRLYGITKEDFKKKKNTWARAIHPDDLERVNQNVALAIEKQEEFEDEFRIIKPDGELRYIKSSALVIRDDKQKAVRMIGINSDITQEKHSEQALKDSESRFKALHNATFGGIAIHDNGIILDCNQGLSDTTGYSVEELISKDGLLLISEDTRKIVTQNITSGYEKSYEVVGLRKTGEEYPLRIQAKNIPYKGKTVRVAEFRDISEQKKTEDTHIMLMTAIEQLAESIIITKPDGIIQYTNPAFEKITGYSSSEVLGKTTSMLESGQHDKTFYHKIYNEIDSGKTWKGRFINRKKDGALFTSESAITPIKNKQGEIVNLVAIEQDISESINKEEQLRQSQKMEAIGQLAGGIAHDFNNLLMAILGYVDLCYDDIGPENPAHEYLQEITTAAERSVAITRQLLAFARKQNIVPEIINPNNAITGILKLLSRMIGENIELKWIPCEDPWSIKLDTGQLDQILTNLFVNARDAIESAGTITVETYNMYVDFDLYNKDYEGVTSGEYVALAISDNGCGIDKKTLDNIFEPFFTTKDVGEGTGLGLATTYGIVKQNNGFINVYSEPKTGTTFRIYFPRCRTDEEQNIENKKTKDVSGGNETILLVEDERNIRIITQKFLEKHGYNVLLAAEPTKAIKKASEYPGKIDLLLSDIIMPIMNGPEMAEKLKKTRPEMKQLFMSGYTANVVSQSEILDENINFLSKPFSSETLTTKIRAILDEERLINSALQGETKC